MPYSKGPWRCDICDHSLKFMQVIRVVAKEGFTRIIFHGQCHNEAAHQVIPHRIQISVRVENLLSHDADGRGWKEIPENAVLSEFDYYEEMRRDDELGMCQNCLESCRDCPEMPNGPNEKED